MLNTELESYLNKLLSISLFKDYAPNGLQIEGKRNIKTIVTGVTASQALIDEAIQLQADALLVHHGYFWPGESQILTGMKGERVRRLIKHDINLLAYHLPLDAHLSLGNNVQLGKQLGLEGIEPINPEDSQCLVFHGYLPEPMSAADFTSHIELALQRTPLISHHPEQKLRHIAWCTGGAQNYLQEAIEFGVDAYISGEVSEHTIHTARENNVVFYAAGHHATERYGIKVLGEWLQQQFNDLDVHFIDIDNPA
ncbi:Nif3-like dinuclear metal center hexameric protein [Tolumonas lignilytica]|uniref:Nif3-like dinuclear metal center hexameric protein n=1 Tax=Tolumonas lignilytica TaxID=1283284 RepID=UPI000465B33A|nr:Nif3-like dinuclear metal center hexameric protein [Tolumonas lignilytica]